MSVRWLKGGLSAACFCVLAALALPGGSGDAQAHGQECIVAMWGDGQRCDGPMSTGCVVTSRHPLAVSAHCRGPSMFTWLLGSAGSDRPSHSGC